MRKAHIYVNRQYAGELVEHDATHYDFMYDENYHGLPVSLTMPLTQRYYTFDRFPSFFEGLLPEGLMLDALLRKYKLDKKDYFGQLIQVGQDVVGAVTIEEVK